MIPVNKDSVSPWMRGGDLILCLAAGTFFHLPLRVFGTLCSSLPAVWGPGFPVLASDPPQSGLPAILINPI
jgi:hypothetical protein